MIIILYYLYTVIMAQHAPSHGRVLSVGTTTARVALSDEVKQYKARNFDAFREESKDEPAGEKALCRNV